MQIFMRKLPLPLPTAAPLAKGCLLHTTAHLVVAHGNQGLDQQAAVQQQQARHQGGGGDAPTALEQSPHLKELRAGHLQPRWTHQIHKHASLNPLLI